MSQGESAPLLPNASRSINMTSDQYRSEEDDWSKPLMSGFHGDADPNRSGDYETISDTGKPVGCCSPAKSWYRFVLLGCVCLLSFGSYFCYDNPGALKSTIQGDMRISNSQFELLYEVYSYLNMVFTFFGGLFLDKIFGLNLGSMLFAVFTLIGQCIFAAGASLGNFTVMVAGRFVFALGGESIAVAQNTYCARWFKGKELAFALGVSLSLSRIGSAVNFNVMPGIADSSGLSTALWVGAIICSISFFMSLVVWTLDKRGSDYVAMGAKKSDDDTDTVKFRDVKKLFSWKVLDFWLVMIICVLFYSAVFPFISFAQSYFEGVSCQYTSFDGLQQWKKGEMASLCTDPSPPSHFNFDTSTASLYASIPYYIAAGISPFFGIIIDKLQRRPMFILIACFMLLGAYATFVFTTLSPLVGLSIFGVSYTLLAASLWPCVPLIVDEKLVGTAYGLMQAIQNAGLGASFAIVGMLNDGNWKDNYYGSLGYFGLCLGLSALCAAILLVHDLSTGAVLWGHRPAKDEYDELDDEIHADDAISYTSDEPLIEKRKPHAWSLDQMRTMYLYKLGINR